MDTWNQGEHMNWEWTHKLRMHTWTQDEHMNWEWTHQLRMNTWTQDEHMNSGWTHKLRMNTWTENEHTNSGWTHELRMNTQTQDEHINWELTHKLRMNRWNQGEHMNWGWTHKLRMNTWTQDELQNQVHRWIKSIQFEQGTAGVHGFSSWCSGKQWKLGLRRRIWNANKCSSSLSLCKSSLKPNGWDSEFKWSDKQPIHKYWLHNHPKLRRETAFLKIRVANVQ